MTTVPPAFYPVCNALLMIVSLEDLTTDDAANYKTCVEKYFKNYSDFKKTLTEITHESKMGNLFLTDKQINALMGLLTKSGLAGKAKASSQFIFGLATWVTNLVKYNWLKHTEDGIEDAIP